MRSLVQFKRFLRSKSLSAFSAIKLGQRTTHLASRSIRMYPHSLYVAAQFNMTL